MKRMRPEARRQAMVTATLTVARTKGFGATTVRDIAAEMGTSSGLIHHYFDSMDDLLATAFEEAARIDLDTVGAAMAAAGDPIEALRAFFASYAPADRDWAFQLWFDAWAEASRRSQLQQTSRRLNMEWQRLLEATIAAGIAANQFECADAAGTAWRILSLIDGLAIQVVAHDVIDRATALAWTAQSAEMELGLAAGKLANLEAASYRAAPS